MDRVQMILVELGKAEDEIFKTRQVFINFFLFMNILDKRYSL